MAPATLSEFPGWLDAELETARDILISEFPTLHRDDINLAVEIAKASVNAQEGRARLLAMARRYLGR